MLERIFSIERKAAAHKKEGSGLGTKKNLFLNIIIWYRRSLRLS